MFAHSVKLSKHHIQYVMAIKCTWPTTHHLDCTMKLGNVEDMPLNTSFAQLTQHTTLSVRYTPSSVLHGVAGQFVTFDSSHIWETGIQTYMAGVQHLQAAPSTYCNPNASKLSELTAKPLSVDELMKGMCAESSITVQEDDQTSLPDAADTDILNKAAKTTMPDYPNTSIKQAEPRRLLLILALRDDNWLKSYIAKLPEPELWQVNVWQAAEAKTSQHAHAVAEALSSMRGQQPVFHSTAAGTKTSWPQSYDAQRVILGCTSAQSLHHRTFDMSTKRVYASSFCLIVLVAMLSLL